MSPRRAVDLSPRALLAAGVSGVLAADLLAAESGRWSLATRAEDLGPGAVQVREVGGKPALAVVSVLGPIDQRATWQPCQGMTDGYDTIEARFNSAVDSVKGTGGRVALVIDSPGGDAAGMLPAVRRMRAYAERAGVQVEAVADERATSAAFALALVGDRVHVPAGGRAASIGTVIVRTQSEDVSKVEVFRSGERKMRPNGVEPLNAQDRADLQAMVEESAAEFAGWVTTRRGNTAEHWLSLKGASLSGSEALKAGLADSNMNAQEVIEMALSEAERADLAGAVGLSASASLDEIKSKMAEHRTAAGEVSALKSKLAAVEAERMALEERTAREKAATEAQAKRAAFVAEVKAAVDGGYLTPPRETELAAHYDAHGEASARNAFGMVRAAAPIVKIEKVGAVPAVSGAGEASPMARMTPEDHAHCKANRLDPEVYAGVKYGRS